MNAYYVGTHQTTADQLAQKLGAEVQRTYPSAPESGDVVFLGLRSDESTAGPLPGGNAFSACRALKENPKVRVFLLIDEGDHYSAEIARFCMADGSVQMHADGTVSDLGVFDACIAAVQDRTPVDDLLEHLEREIASDEGRRASAIQRMLADERHDWVVDNLADRATGLFAGPFASFKLEEEFKRSMRFHQPLSLILLDIGGEAALPPEGPSRDGLLAEVASVFLNECRDIDVLARFTETTFLFLLPGTGAAGASVVARRMLEELGERSMGAGAKLVSRAGLATIPAAGIDNRGAFLARAEACLRLAQEGRSPDGLCVSCE